MDDTTTPGTAARQPAEADGLPQAVATGQVGPARAEAADAPVPPGVDRAPTGHPQVDAALERLGSVDHLPAEGHLEVYEDVHRGLRDTLTALDAPHPHPGPPNDLRS
ncbi:hypothetical protein [Streptomyces sp. CC228A]|uniref:hypothetical protein n=1 Tax=Streptomyces sp. CC228A TaxID=2898186 RepID=UPI001F23FF03|nr:hypothetical protein [Streptomyces sp. CC228A]